MKEADDNPVAGNPALVLLSGGIDSTTLLHRVCRERGADCVHALSFLYGQKHARELDAARRQAEAVGAASHRVVDLAFLGELTAGGTVLTTAGGPVPDLHALDAETLRQPPTYVPNRNLVLLASAGAYAESHGIVDIFYGAQAQDHYGYWDCSCEFVTKLNALLALNRRTAVRVHAPFVAWSKTDIVRLGLELGVDFEATWTCYRGGDAPCGSCPSCVERQRAFAEAHRRDPLQP